MQRYQYEDQVLKSDLPENAQRVLIIMAAECIWKSGNEVYLSYSKFAEYKVKPRTRDKWLPVLRDAGWIRDTGKSAGRGGCTIYELVVPDHAVLDELPHDHAVVAESEVPHDHVELPHHQVELPHDQVGTTARSCGLNSDTNNDLNKDTNKEELGAVADAPAPVDLDKEDHEESFLSGLKRKQAEMKASRTPRRRSCSSASSLSGDTGTGTVPTQEPSTSNDPLIGSTDAGTASKEDKAEYYEWNGKKIQRAGTGDPFGGVAVMDQPKVKTTPCPKCSAPMEKDLCWNLAC